MWSNFRANYKFYSSYSWCKLVCIRLVWTHEDFAIDSNGNLECDGNQAQFMNHFVWRISPNKILGGFKELCEGRPTYHRDLTCVP
jgi:hypothetical protein